MRISGSITVTTAVLGFLLSAKTSPADDLYFYFHEIGNDVSLRFEGSLDTSRFNLGRPVNSTVPAHFHAASEICAFQAVGTAMIEYASVLQDGLFFSSRGQFFATSFSGDVLVINGRSISLAPSYASGSPLRGEMVFANKTLRALGLDQYSLATFARTNMGDNRIHIEVSKRATADLRINDNASGSTGVNVIDRRNPRPVQTLRVSRPAGRRNTAVAYLWLANIGDAAARFHLATYGDRHPGMKASFECNGRNVTGSVRSGRFEPYVEGGDSPVVIYRLMTQETFAGVLRNGDIDEKIRFRMSGAGTVDNVAMEIRYLTSPDKSTLRPPRGIQPP